MWLTTTASYQFSDSKKDMDAKAIEMTKNTTEDTSCIEEQTATKSNIPVFNTEVYIIVSSGAASRKQQSAKNRKKTEQSNSNEGTQDRVRSSHKSVKALQKRAELDASNAAAEQIFQKTDVQALQAEIEELKQQLTKAKDTSHV